MANDFISRQAAIEIASGYCHPANIVKELEQMPSTDVIEVVRCKSCKYFDRYTTVPEVYQWDAFCLEWARNTYKDWFCSRAERRTDE